MRTTLRLAILAAALATALAVSGALPSGASTTTPRAPAHAAALVGLNQAAAPAAPAALFRCPSGDFCVYSLPGFGGAIYGWSGNDANWSNNYFNLGSGIFVTVNNYDHSWTNNGTACAGCDHVRVFNGTNYGGGRTICLNRGQAVSANSSAADKGSSHSWYGSC